MVGGDDLLAWTTASILALLGLGAFLALRRHGRSWAEAFRVLAERRGGTHRAGAFAFPSATIPLAKGAAFLTGSYASQTSSNVVEAAVEAPAPWPARLTLHPHGHALAILALFQGGRIRTGDPAFDRNFILSAEPPGAAEVLVDAELREVLLALARMGRTGDVVALLHPAGLKIRKHNVPPDADVLDALVDAAETLLAKAEGLRTGRVEMAFLTPPTLEAPAPCPVCGSTLDRDLVWCRSCSTPHHRECWKFNRGCAAFACGSTAFTRKAR